MVRFDVTDILVDPFAGTKVMIGGVGMPVPDVIEPVDHAIPLRVKKSITVRMVPF